MNKMVCDNLVQNVESNNRRLINPDFVQPLLSQINNPLILTLSHCNQKILRKRNHQRVNFLRCENFADNQEVDYAEIRLQPQIYNVARFRQEQEIQRNTRNLRDFLQLLFRRVNNFQPDSSQFRSRQIFQFDFQFNVVG